MNASSTDLPNAPSSDDMTSATSAVLTDGRYRGETRNAPYPVSRMAPAFQLVDLALEIQKADEQLATVTGERLRVVADQIRRLQESARIMLEKTRKDAELHRALCNFEKKPGGMYHHYEGRNGGTWFSLLAPNEWVVSKPKHLGSYRLEPDQSFTALEDIAPRDQDDGAIARLLGDPNAMKSLPGRGGR
jgi:Protein of unknown function (DUF2452)